MQQVPFWAMGCHMLAILDSEAPRDARYLQPVPGWFEEWEQHLSRFRSDSELSHLNRHAGEPYPVSPTLWEVIQSAREAARQSDGIVTPLLLDALESAGYSRSFDELVTTGESPVESDMPVIPDAMPPVPTHWQAIETDSATRTVRLSAGMRLDLNGVAKGWAADQAMQRLRKYAPVLVDAGGDIAMSGTREGGERWPIAITDPHNPGQQLELLMMGGGGVATSGRDYRRWQQGGRWQHHIIDPRTNQPARTDLLSVTVVAPTVAQAEVAARVVLILGSNAGLSWLEARSPLAALLVREDGRSIRSKRLHHYVW